MIRSQETQKTKPTSGETLSVEPSGGRAYCYETSRVWEEAGFMPPAVCQVAVEILHLQGMEEGTAGGGFPSLAREILPQTESIRDRCVITDPVRLRETALEWGMPTAGMSDQEIAYLMTLSIIADYFSRP